jgi:glycerol-3-phosphate acyltransferase PlsY
MPLNITVALVIGYLLGSIPSAYIAGRLKKGIDIREVGGGNMGALNVIHQVGTVVGYTVWLADMAKGSLAILIAQWFNLPLPWVFATGFAAVVGHNWPVFLRFRGGKGAATIMGIFLILIPAEFGISFAIIAIIVFLTSNPALGLGIGLACLPLIIKIFNNPDILLVYSITLMAFLFTRYLLAGLKRSRAGTNITKGLIVNKEYSWWQSKKR